MWVNSFIFIELDYEDLIMIMKSTMDINIAGFVVLVKVDDRLCSINVLYICSACSRTLLFSCAHCVVLGRFVCGSFSHCCWQRLR